MGEIAEMMLDGAMCQWCGEFIEEEAGFPTICAGCQKQHGVDAFGEPRKGRSKPRQASAKTDIPRLSRKLHNRIVYIEKFCNGHSGMYPGDHYDLFWQQYNKLQALGYVERYVPHNPAHKERAIITDRGRQYLRAHA